MTRKSNNPLNYDLGPLAVTTHDYKVSTITATQKAEEFKRTYLARYLNAFTTELGRAYESRVSVAELARTTGYTRTWIYKILDDAGFRDMDRRESVSFLAKGTGHLEILIMPGERYGVHEFAAKDKALFKYWTAERMNSGVQEWRVQVLDVQGKLNAQQWTALLSGTTADTRLHEELVKYLDSRHPDLADAPTS